jgi:hypothetical protein
MVGGIERVRERERERERERDWVWWLTPVILRRQRSEKLWFTASPSKKLMTALLNQ